MSGEGNSGLSVHETAQPQTEQLTMFHHILPPHYLNLKTTGEIAKNWKLWRAKYNNYLAFSRLDKESPEYQLVMVKHVISNDGLKVIRSFTCSEGENANNWHIVMGKMEKHCIGEVTRIYERYCFNKKDKLPTETVDNFIELKTLAKTTFAIVYLTIQYAISLYTSLSHAQLIKQLHDLLERVFTMKGKSFIATNNFRSFWTNDRTSTRYTYFSCGELYLAIDFLIANSYVRFGSSVFQQVIGIPMGNNSAPLLADLFLHTSKYDFMVKTNKQDFAKALQFSDTFRYIDDLLSINNVDFGNDISAIYPSEMQLKDTFISSTEVWYLDKNIKRGDIYTPFCISIYNV